MTISISDIFRHPIKAHGVEPLTAVPLSAGKCLPGDRAWAVLDAKGRFEGAWASCINFARGAKSPELMGITAETDPKSGAITLRHRLCSDITLELNRAEDRAALIEWTAPLIAEDRPASTEVVSAGRGMTDTDYESISINAHASRRAVSQAVGREMSPLRFRGNLWVEGTAPWEEFEWIGKTVRIGKAVLEVTEPIGRCRATTANPETGKRDTDTLGILRDRWGHTDFGVFAQVVKPGAVSIGDSLEIL